MGCLFGTIDNFLSDSKAIGTNEARKPNYWDLIEIMYRAVNIASGRKENFHLKKKTINKEKTYKRNPVKWWDEECKAVITTRKEKLKTYLKEGSLITFIEYKKSCAIVRKTVKSKKRESFKNFCNSINRWTGLIYVWKTVKILKHSFSKVTWNEWQTIDREKVIMQEVEKIAPPVAMPQNELFVPFTYDLDTDPMNAPFSMAEVNRAIDLIKRISAPGRDGIDYMMIKRLSAEFRSSLLEIFNDIWNTADIPYTWTEYQIHFIDKIGKKKVRPIALSSCMGKLMERMVNERLIWWAENNNIIHESQNGFRRGKSCINNLVKIMSDVKSTIYREGYSMAAFLNVSSAYDNVQFHILSGKLIKANCPSRIVIFLNNWLRERSTQFIINNKDPVLERTVRKGLPQGAVLSPLLYDIYTANITKDIPDNIRVVQFADDIAIYTMGADRRENKNILHEALCIMDNNLSDIGLQLEPSKTSIIEFSKSGYVDINMDIDYNGNLIKNTAEARFLGILMDNQLKFVNHISYIRGKIEKANNVVKYVSGVTRGPEINTALMLYKSLVRSVYDKWMLYLCPAIQPGDNKVRKRTILGIVNSLGIPEQYSN